MWWIVRVNSGSFSVSAKLSVASFQPKTFHSSNSINQWQPQMRREVVNMLIKGVVCDSVSGTVPLYGQTWHVTPKQKIWKACKIIMKLFSQSAFIFIHHQDGHESKDLCIRWQQSSITPYRLDRSADCYATWTIMIRKLWENAFQIGSELIVSSTAEPIPIQLLKLTTILIKWHCCLTNVHVT